MDSNAVAYSETGSLISVLATPTGCGDASSKEAGTACKSYQRLFQVKWQSMFVDTTSCIQETVATFSQQFADNI